MVETESSQAFSLFLFFMAFFFSASVFAYRLVPAPDGKSAFKWEKQVLLVSCHSDLREVVEKLSDQNLALLGECIVPALECSESEKHDALINKVIDWSYGDQVLAITKNSYDLRLGLILFSNIELNALKLKNYPVENTLNHEIGHLLGLGHSSDPEATMHESALPGEVKKASLNSDDKKALCYLYSLDSSKVDFESEYCDSQEFLPGSANNQYEFYCDSVDLKDGSGGCMLTPEKPLNALSILFYIVSFLVAFRLRPATNGAHS